MKKHLLVVEDDTHIRLGLCDALRGEGYEVSECRDGAQAGPIIRQRRPDLVILDIMLPGKSGFDLCRELRAEKNRTPILMLSAKGQEIDKVVGLELGADDYVTKPFNLRELVLRMRAVLRRYEEHATTRGGDLLRADDFLLVDLPRRAVTVDGERVTLTVIEFDLVVHLLRVRGRVQTRERLLRDVWGYDYAGYDRTIDTHVARLRKKLGARGDWIETAWGVGYRFRE